MSTVAAVLDRIEELEEDVQGNQEVLDRYADVNRDPLLAVKEATHRDLLQARQRLGAARRELADAQMRLPYRPRVEIVLLAHTSTGIFAAWTRWENDQTLQFLGGGIEDLEKPEEAVKRVLLAKTMLVPEKVRVVPGLHAVTAEWNYPFDGPKQRERAANFRGSMTFLTFADLGQCDELPELPGVFAWHPIEVRPDNNADKAQYPDLSRARACALDIVSRLHTIL